MMAGSTLHVSARARGPSEHEVGVAHRDCCRLATIIQHDQLRTSAVAVCAHVQDWAAVVEGAHDHR